VANPRPLLLWTSLVEAGSRVEVEVCYSSFARSTYTFEPPYKRDRHLVFEERFQTNQLRTESLQKTLHRHHLYVLATYCQFELVRSGKDCSLHIRRTVRSNDEMYCSRVPPCCVLKPTLPHNNDRQNSTKFFFWLFFIVVGVKHDVL
jgi:hypothetical protein